MNKNPIPCSTSREPLWLRLCNFWILLLTGTVLLSACGGGNSNSGTQQSSPLAGNWQFSLVNTPDLTTSSGLQGGFLLQNNGSITGAVVYANTLLSSGIGTGPCNSGSAPMTGTISSQTVTLTAVAGTQTFALTGTLNSDGSMSGNYTATAGPVVSGTTTPCGAGTASGTALTWTAIPVPPLTGSITGSFHSASPYSSGLNNQDFPLTGTLTQGGNIGASNATVTGTLSFVNPTTLLSDYPCVPSGFLSVNGEISGNTVVLQLIGTSGLNAGQIGVPASQVNASGPQPVTFDSTTNGYVLHSTGTGYVVNTSNCPNNSTASAEDGGFICLALNSTAACQQPITLSPALLTFPAQLLGSTNPSTQTITLANNSGNELTGLTLLWAAPSGPGSDVGQTDFTNLADFTEADNCAVPTGSPFSLLAGQSCLITVSFVPQESCTWLPTGVPPAQCPLTLNASLTVNNVPSVDNDMEFLVPVTGTGLSFLQPSTPELDFGAEAFGEVSLAQSLSFTNYAATPVQVLPQATCVNTSLTEPPRPLPHPLMENSPVAGLQVVSNAIQDTNQSTIAYECDFDNSTNQPNFQISADTCSGTLLAPQATCSLEIAFAPQSVNTYFSALEYFLELNTVQCVLDPTNPNYTGPPSQSNPCELDGGRFPVALRANIASPLRMSPSAGLDFGTVSVGKSSVTQTVTLLNDPTLTDPQTVSFVGKFVVSGSYSETDDCPFSLSPGGSCTLIVTFKPAAVGHNPGTLNINYTTNSDTITVQTQTVYLFGTGQ